MQYLSEDWIDAADTALRAAATSAPAGRLVIDQHVESVCSYRIIIDAHDSSLASIDAAESDEAHATFRQDWDTAVAVAQGTTDAHQAFLLGHIRFVGDITTLIERRAAFDWVSTTLAPVMAATEF